VHRGRRRVDAVTSNALAAVAATAAAFRGDPLRAHAPVRGEPARGLELGIYLVHLHDAEVVAVEVNVRLLDLDNSVQLEVKRAVKGRSEMGIGERGRDSQ
jgi:hypothetical protein